MALAAPRISKHQTFSRKQVPAAASPQSLLSATSFPHVVERDYTQHPGEATVPIVSPEETKVQPVAATGQSARALHGQPRRAAAPHGAPRHAPSPRSSRMSERGQAGAC